jgi:hypothetical protein
MNEIKSGKDFLLQLLFSAFIFAVIGIALVFVANLTSRDDEPSKSAPTSGYRDSEYQDAMESKHYDPNGEGGSICNSPICD